MTSGADRLENDKDYLAALRRDMLRFTRLQLRDEHLAEDVVQEALATALTGKREFEGRSALKDGFSARRVQALHRKGDTG